MPTPKCPPVNKPKVKTFAVNIVYTVEQQPDDSTVGTLADEKRIWNEEYKQVVLDGTKVKKFSIRVIK